MVRVSKKEFRAEATNTMRQMWPAFKKRIDNWLGATDSDEDVLDVLPQIAWSDKAKSFVVSHGMGTPKFKVSITWKITPK